MLTFHPHKTGIAALATGAVLMASTLMVNGAPAQAKSSKEKLYKGGAVALGVLGAYWILQGKTVQGAAAAAGGYYAYKKGKEENDRDYDRDYDHDWRRSDRDRDRDRDRDHRSSRRSYRDNDSDQVWNYGDFDRGYDRGNDRDCRLR